MDISVVIPNYNGENLIKKNLNKVAEVIYDFSKKKNKRAEIVVVDDFSEDNSMEELGEIKKSWEGKLKIKIIKNDKNYGFSTTANNGVRVANGEILILLNTDITPENDFLTPLLRHFEDKNVFAVGCMDKSIEDKGVVLRGRGLGEWKRGFLSHRKGNIEGSNTLWVSGGSGAFRRSIWQKLGGLNEIYNPFYWEDIDLSYRALKSGYRLFFEKESIVIHEHEKGAIKSKYSSHQVKIIAYRNQFIFVWTNADFSILLINLLFLPYHILKAVFDMDKAFFIGFFKAIVLMPKILEASSENRKLFVKTDYQIVTEVNK